ncbi:Zn(II)2Cys6 transcription factor domain-containing protein [Aspergillus brunneoviolaceus CBS 621.78]|uniref:Uncharacterized protein n=1 Tax=Aspergillus brunneoviolaceus CBS 621.78 TaxID=1450534 RepID=A0ACD1G6N0_9EURO|nr:hypothetical protein BO95DRAFT_464556 [Aspergillus brunneoviolaceus CBS 621.78]RAH44776.1 hypothetical protein BO95DRAFT_464556 [Aspergillus brunneoviolaceus CBS 621.78]
MASKRSAGSSSHKLQSQLVAERDAKSVGRNLNSKTPGRTLAACDTCRQSKIRCSGGNPCMACQWYPKGCNYSPAGKLGRPKGSKNKRTLLQHNLQLEKEQPTRVDEDTTGRSSGTDTLQWNRPGQEQLQARQRSSSQSASGMNTFDFDLAHIFDSGIAFEEGGIPKDNMGHDMLLEMDQSYIECMRTDGASAFGNQGCLDQAMQAIGNANLSTSNDATGQPCMPNSSYAPTSGHSRASSISSESLFTRGTSGCLCLPQLIRLLYRLQELHSAHDQYAGEPSVESVLRGVQTAKLPWKAFMHCDAHSVDDNARKALLLFAMTIRILLSAVRRLNSSINPSRTEALSAIAVSVGTFELFGETKAEIIGVVVRRSLGAITTASQYLWERAGTQLLD